MKVLEKGREIKGWTAKYTCTGKGNGGYGCRAKLLIEEGDLYHTHNYDYGGGQEIYITFKCPECSVETDISRSGIPSRVRIKEKL